MTYTLIDASTGKARCTLDSPFNTMSGAEIMANLLREMSHCDIAIKEVKE